MKNSIKKSLPLIFVGLLLLGSYSYVCHQEFVSSNSPTAQIKEKIQENTYHLPDVELLKRILDLAYQFIQ